MGERSAGQSAVYLSRFATEVDVVIRRGDLNPDIAVSAEQMQQRLNIRIRPRTVVERFEGEGRLERVWLKS